MLMIMLDEVRMMMVIVIDTSSPPLFITPPTECQNITPNEPETLNIPSLRFCCS